MSRFTTFVLQNMCRSYIHLTVIVQTCHTICWGTMSVNCDLGAQWVSSTEILKLKERKWGLVHFFIFRKHKYKSKDWRCMFSVKAVCNRFYCHILLVQLLKYFTRQWMRHELYLRHIFCINVLYFKILVKQTINEPQTWIKKTPIPSRKMDPLEQQSAKVNV